MKRLVTTTARRLGLEVRRYQPGYREDCVELETRHPPRGNVLLAYMVDPFLLPPDASIPTDHTNHTESVRIAQAWLDLGFNVDVIDYRNRVFVPGKTYRILVSARTQFDRLAALVGADCVKIAHLDTAHFLFNNQAAYTRALELQRRRGAVCTSVRIVESNRAIENADYGALLGGAILRETYAYAGKPLYCLPVPTLLTYPSPDTKNFDEVRRRFLWFGSTGFVHKGLDRVLEAFAGMPDMELRVCGPIAREPEFAHIYERELYRTPNIRAVGWVDVAAPEFLDVAQSSLALVFPTCAESQSASSLTCMQAGLIPILSREAGIEAEDFGIVLRDASIAEIRHAVRRLAALPSGTLRRMACAARDYAATAHTLDRYSEAYRAMAQDILQRESRRLPAVADRTAAVPSNRNATQN